MIANTNSGYIGGPTCRQIALTIINGPCRNVALSLQNLLPPIVTGRLPFKGRTSPVQQRNGGIQCGRTRLLLFDKRLKVGFRFAASDQDVPFLCATGFDEFAGINAMELKAPELCLLILLRLRGNSPL